MTAQFKVLRPGAYTTVQDAGRYGYQRYGVPPSGALDRFAFQVANILVGNPEGTAVLEFTAFGPRVEVLAEADVAITGAHFPMSLNGQSARGWSRFRVRPGDILDMGSAHSGCRGYLAVTGGIDVPVVMGSRSTYVDAKVGGFNGRLLATEDVVWRGEGELIDTARRLPEKLIPRYASEIVLRAILGPQDDFFADGILTFFGSEFIADANSNRMGYRLRGPRIIQCEGTPKSILSEPTLPGGVQVPADGQPIILLVEQTAGGYTKIATVISADIPLIAQARPGDRLRFRQVSLEAGHAAFRRREELITNIKNLLAKSL